MRKSKLLASAALTASLAAGGLAGAMFGAPSLSGAEESSASAPSESHHHRRAANPGGRPHHRGPALEAAAEALGMTADDLRAALRDGRSIADVAAERDVEVQTVIDAMVGAITENVEERVSQMVNHRRGSGERGREGATPPAEGTAA